jgi:LPS sulfotransferase NodH
MRVLIIAHHRSGSTSFGQWLSMELGYLWIPEPYNTDTHEWNWDRNKRIEYAFNSPDIVSKFGYCQFENYNQIQDTINAFDKVILLKRNNIRESAISTLMANDTQKWHDKYQITEEWLEMNKNRIEEEMISFVKINDEISKLDGLQITYEGIYNTKTDIENVRKYIGIDTLKYTHYIDKMYRYQNNTNKKSMI